MPHQRKIAAIVSKLLEWYPRNARDLPWRRTRDPYAVWVSEVMLQQTQVSTVVPYWGRWMKALPNIRALAKAEPEKVLKLWEGLGYYARARNLQRAAQLIIARHGGAYPNDFEAMLALPGIGRYTAGAIASIAFDQPKPILDGNVVRVLTRLFGIAKDPREKGARDKLWQLAEELVLQASHVAHHASRITDHGSRITHHVSHLNQSLMELGALVCTPEKAGCEVCPVALHCQALRQGRVEQIPASRKLGRASRRRFVAFLLERGGRFLVRKRPAGVVNAHLWEFPNMESAVGRDGVLLAASNIIGVKPGVLEPLGVIRHAITRYRITLEVFRAGGVGGNGKKHKHNGTKWLRPHELSRLPFASAHGKVLRQWVMRGFKKK